MKKLFFSVSNDVTRQVTDLYDFVWPTASAMWNFRWQVRGFVNEVGIENVNQQNLLGRFDWGSGIHGLNIKRAVLEKTWDEQQERFAKFLLVNLIAIYESWIDGIQSTLGFPREVAQQLQFPSTIDNNGNPWGINSAIGQIATRKSPILQHAFYAPLRNRSKYSLHQLENLLLCFRFFKECRNSLAHRGGVADQKVYDSYVAFSSIATPESLNLYEVPDHYPIVIGQPVKLSLRGVVGFGDVIIKLVSTLDAELSICAQAENELITRFRTWATLGTGRAKKNLKKKIEDRNQQMLRFLRSLEFPEPTRTDEIVDLLLKEGILRENYP